MLSCRLFFLDPSFSVFVFVLAFVLVCFITFILVLVLVILAVLAFQIEVSAGTCFHAHRLLISVSTTSDKPLQAYFQNTALAVLMAPHVSKHELALVRGWQSEGWAAKEMWELHRAERTGRQGLECVFLKEVRFPA